MFVNKNQQKIVTKKLKCRLHEKHILGKLIKKKKINVIPLALEVFINWYGMNGVNKMIKEMTNRRD